MFVNSDFSDLLRIFNDNHVNVAEKMCTKESFSKCGRKSVVDNM